MSSIKIYDGIFMMENAFIQNLRLEHLGSGLPSNLANTGRMWFDQINNEVKVSVSEDNSLIAKTLLFKEDAQSMGIGIDQAGWKDELGHFNSAKTKGTTEPIWADIGNGLYAWQFSDDKNMEVFISYHINHYAKQGAKVYPHIHWIPIGYSTGNVKWQIDWTLAKGYEQSEVLTGGTNQIILEQNASGLYGEHHIIEATDNQAIIVDEPDMYLMCKVSRIGKDAGDTFVGSIAGLTMDLHVYSEGSELTPGKNYPFDVPELPGT